MAKKLQTFFIYKLLSSRAKDDNYKIKIDLSRAKANGEVVRVGDSELIKVILSVTGREFSDEKLSELESKKNRIKRKSNSIRNREALYQIEKEIDTILFIPELVSVKFDNTTHYEAIIKNGLFINGHEFVRVLSGAGNLRRNTVFFIDKSIYQSVIKILDNGRKDVELNPAKFSAYFGLYGSAGTQVSFPRFSVVSDYEFELASTVNFVDFGMSVSEKKMNLPLNAFDGQGLISYRMANTWSFELGLDYIPSTFIVRAPFIKGQLVTFDFQEFAKSFEKTSFIDIWGNEVNVDDVDIILSASQFKMITSYSGVGDYISNCHKNNLGFRVSRVSHRIPKSNTKTNYMFLQVLDLSDDEIESLCSDTVKFFDELTGSDVDKMILYLGNGLFSTTESIENDWFEKLDVIARALIINREMAKDPYIISSFINSLQKKIRESYLGKLIVPGNFSPLVADPYAQAQHVFGIPVKGLLKSNEHYADFWNKRNVKTVAGGRSPLTHNSEMMALDLVDTDETRFWYQYQTSSFILPIFSLDTVRMADGDFDGDLIFTSSQKEIINGRITGNPIAYEKRVAEKRFVSQDELWDTDIKGFFSNVGLSTNISSTYHTLKNNFDENSDERLELEKRLIILRMLQGEFIDKAKNGGKALEIPSDWINWRKQLESESDDEWQMKMGLLADRRPLFTRYLYKSYWKTYKDEMSVYHAESMMKFGIPFETLLTMTDRTEDEQDLVNRYSSRSFFIRNDSVMNRISEHMLTSVSDALRKNYSNEYDYRVLLSEAEHQITSDEISKMQSLMKRYNAMRHSLRHGDPEKYKTVESIIARIRNMAFSEISSNEQELANIAVVLCYGVLSSNSRSFAWNVFGEGIIQNLLSKSDKHVMLPVLDDEGKIEYLYSKYSLKEVVINDDETIE